MKIGVRHLRTVLHTVVVTGNLIFLIFHWIGLEPFVLEALAKPAALPSLLTRACRACQGQTRPGLTLVDEPPP